MMIYQLKKKKIGIEFIATLVVIVICLTFLVYYVVVIKKYDVLTWMAIMIPALSFYAVQRYQTDVIFDFDTQTIKTISVFPFIKHNYPFRKIEKVTIIKAVGLMQSVGFKSSFPIKNLIIKVVDNVQPQTYTIENSSDEEIAKQILLAWNKTA